MPSFVRPTRGGGGSAAARSAPAAPMSERQQLALLMQMTGGEGSRSPQHSTRPRDRNERGETPLHLAAIKGDVDAVSKLLAHKADPNVGDFAGWMPLHEACNHGWYEIAVKLVQAGANVNAKGLDNETPLHDAAINGHMQLIKLLVEQGADIYAKNSKGKTPLDVAATPSVADFLQNTNLPISETSASTRLQPRSRDEKKVTDKKADDMDPKAASVDDVYEFKATKTEAEKPPMDKNEEQESETLPESIAQPDGESSKRNFSEISEDNNDGSLSTEDELRRKKRKDSDAKDAKTAGMTARSGANSAKGLNTKANTAVNKITTAAGGKDRKSPVDSPNAASDAELEDGKSDLKVPPLKIVIPQSSIQEQEAGQTRNGKNNSQRSHAALPYVVASSTEGEKDANSGNNSPTESVGGKERDEKKEPVGATNGEEKAHQRVLRSSHRSGQADRSNNSSPQLQRSHSPSPSASPAAPTQEIPVVTTQGTTSGTNKSSDSQASNNSDTEPSTSSSNSNSGNANAAPVELHPRKRKMKPSKEATAPAASDTQETPAVSEVHPHEQPITNCYQLFLNIRKQIDKRRKGLFPVQPKPPQGFKDYLMNRGTYVLAGRAPTTPNITFPATLAPPMKDIFSDQEKERYKLRMQHVIEKEKLVLSVEQEILRVHGRAARALANQSLPFSVCTILRDEEVYNLITPEQEEKDRNARSRYNGRLFLSWLQDVDDKWEKIKEHMLLRHHNEAESLYAVQKMDWEWKLKELNLCDAKSTPSIDDLHVPMVHVSDDFDLLPA